MRYNIFAKPIVKLGALLGASYVLALYLFYFGGREIIMDTNLGSTIQLLTILGLYFGLIYCRRLFPLSKFWQLFLFGVVIMAIAITLKTIFSIILYNVIDPELGINYTKTIKEQMDTAMSSFQSVPKEQYATSKSMINPLSIPIMEGISLFFTGVFFSAFIALMLRLFRK